MLSSVSDECDEVVDATTGDDRVRRRFND